MKKGGRRSLGRTMLIKEQTQHRRAYILWQLVLPSDIKRRTSDRVHSPKAAGYYWAGSLPGLPKGHLKKTLFGIFSKSIPYAFIFSFLLTATTSNLCFVLFRFVFVLAIFFYRIRTTFLFKSAKIQTWWNIWLQVTWSWSLVVKS